MFKGTQRWSSQGGGWSDGCRPSQQDGHQHWGRVEVYFQDIDDNHDDNHDGDDDDDHHDHDHACMSTHRSMANMSLTVGAEDKTKTVSCYANNLALSETKVCMSNQWKDVRNEPRWRLTRSPSSILPALQASLATGPESWWALNRIKPPKCAQVSKLSKKGEGGRAASIEVHGAVGKSVASSPMVRWGTDRWGGRHQVWSS